MDIIAAINHATGCHHCGAPLDASPSDDFCGQDCQQAWAAARTAPDYREPVGFGPEDYASVPRRWMLGFDGAPGAPLVLHTAGDIGIADAVTTFIPGQVYVADTNTQFEYVPGNGWGEIGTAGTDVVFTSTTPDGASPLRDLAEAVRRHAINIPQVRVEFESAEVNWDLDRRYFLGEPEKPPAVEGPADPRERALWLRQHRNTGPAQRQRPPRAINARRHR